MEGWFLAIMQYLLSMICSFYYSTIMLHPVEFLVEGYLLPPTIGRLRVSEKLMLEQVWRRGRESRFSHEQTHYTIAYVGVATPKEANPFPIAGDYLDFFLLIYSLVSGQPVTTTMGIVEEAVIDLVIACEALLCTETRKIRENLSRRLSTLIAGNETEKAEISKKMRELYELRSGIVHGGGKKPSFSDVRILFNYVRRAIECGLSLRHLSKKELVAKLDKA